MSFIVSLDNLHSGVFLFLISPLISDRVDGLAGLGSVTELAVQAICLPRSQFTQPRDGMVRLSQLPRVLASVRLSEPGYGPHATCTVLTCLLTMLL